MQDVTKYTPPEEIIHDPVMWKRYVEAMNFAIELEIALVRRESNVQRETDRL
jgi:hypothetical protein